MKQKILFGLLFIAAGLAVAIAVPTAYRDIKAELHEHLTPLTAQIVGPSTVSGPGDDAIYHVITPGHDPRLLIFSLGMKPLVHGQTQLSTAGLEPGYFRASTRPGNWTINCSATDPRTRESVMTSFELSVPKAADPKPDVPDKPKPVPDSPEKPNPAPPVPGPSPNPSPPTPAPAPAPSPAPVSRFSELTDLVKGLVAKVTSPNKAMQMSAIAAGARAIAQRCRDGDLSKLSGRDLETAIMAACQKTNLAAVGLEAAFWRTFALEVNTWISGAITAKKIKSPADYADALEAFAAGLTARHLPSLEIPNARFSSRPCAFA